MAPSRRIVAIVALAALAFTACSRNDAKESDIVDAMTDAGLSQTQAKCVGDGLTKELDQDQLNKLASATSPEDYPEGTSSTVDSVLEECVGSGSSSTTEGTGSDSSDTTDTTGEGDSSTTTATTG
jgi:hypothetical protein